MTVKEFMPIHQISPPQSISKNWESLNQIFEMLLLLLYGEIFRGKWQNSVMVLQKDLALEHARFEMWCEENQINHCNEAQNLQDNRSKCLGPRLTSLSGFEFSI